MPKIVAALRDRCQFFQRAAGILPAGFGPPPSRRQEAPTCGQITELASQQIIPKALGTGAL